MMTRRDHFYDWLNCINTATDFDAAHDPSQTLGGSSRAFRPDNWRVSMPGSTWNTWNTSLVKMRTDVVN